MVANKEDFGSVEETAARFLVVGLPFPNPIVVEHELAAGVDHGDDEDVVSVWETCNSKAIRVHPRALTSPPAAPADGRIHVVAIDAIILRGSNK